MKKTYKGKYGTALNSGITLVSLVITIIVMLILGGVAITIAVNGDGIFGKAMEARDKWNNSLIDEENEYNKLKEELYADEGIRLNKRTLSLSPGETEKLTATIWSAGTTNKNMTWTSNNEAVATVDQTGKVTAVAEGTATITVATKTGDKTATCVVTVVIPIVSEYITEGSRKAPIPVGYVASEVDGENTISGGLVIYKGTDAVNSTNHATALTTRDQYVLSLIHI